MERRKWQFDVECAKCRDVIFSEYCGQYKTCKCGAIAVDQTPHYSRYIGNREDFIFPEENNNNDDSSKQEPDSL